MKQNVTLSIEKDLIKKGKVMAARKDTCISKMLADMLKEMVENDDRYEAAKRSALQLSKKGLHLGGKIQVCFTRMVLFFEGCVTRF
jgi:hypothetical protein